MNKKATVLYQYLSLFMAGAEGLEEMKENLK